MVFDDYLKIMVEKDGSDIFMSTGAPISAKIHGHLVPLSDESLVADETKEVGELHNG